MQKENMENLLSRTLQKDLALQYTSTGIHKDDLLFTLIKEDLIETEWEKLTPQLKINLENEESFR